MDYIIVQKSTEIFCCSKCHYNTSRKSQYDRHILTDKHKKITQDDVSCYIKVPKSSESYFCKCGKEYKHRQGLWKHKKTCKAEDNSNNVVVKENINDKDQLILMLVKQNAELIKETTDFKSMMMEVIKNGTHNNNSHNTNSHNKSYSKVSDKYNKLIIESMGGSGDNDAEKEDKIVRNIVKNVVVDKATIE